MLIYFFFFFCQLPLHLSDQVWKKKTKKKQARIVINGFSGVGRAALSHFAGRK